MEKQMLLGPSIGKGIAPPPPALTWFPRDPHGGQEAWFKEIGVGPETFSAIQPVVLAAWR